MQLDHHFTVPAPLDEAWKVLLDLPRIAPCMPGANLTEFDGEAFTGTVKVKLGPVSLTYRGKGRFTEIDEDNHQAVISASGKETRGSGTASATITATLADEGETTGVNVATDLRVTGRPAQFGRGMLADVGDRLLGQFSECLATKLGQAEESEAPEDPAREQSTAAATTEGATSGGSKTASRPAASAAATDTANAGQGASSANASDQSQHASSPASEADVEPIDLLEVTGVQAALRKYGPTLAVGVAGAGVATAIGLLIRRLVRRGRRGRRSRR